MRPDGGGPRAAARTYLYKRSGRYGNDLVLSWGLAPQIIRYVNASLQIEARDGII